jgi:hypothetical protein
MNTSKLKLNLQPGTGTGTESTENTQCADCQCLNNINNNLNNTRFIQELDNIIWYNIDYDLSISHFIGKNISFLAQQ